MQECKTNLLQKVIGDFTTGVTNYFSGISWSIGSEGSEGGMGGDTGFSGFGGNAGNAGSIIIKSPKIGFMNINKNHGTKGKDGEWEKATPGLAGKHGRDGISWVLAADIVRLYQLENCDDKENMKLYSCRCYDRSVIRESSGYYTNTINDRSNDYGFVYRSAARTYGTTVWCKPYYNVGKYETDYRNSAKYNDDTKNGKKNKLKHTNCVIAKNIDAINVDEIYSLTKKYMEQFCTMNSTSYQSWNANKFEIFLNQMSFEFGKNSV